MTLEMLVGFELLKRAAVSGLEQCLRSRGMCFRISRWSTGMPSRLKNDLIPRVEHTDNQSNNINRRLLINEH